VTRTTSKLDAAKPVRTAKKTTEAPAKKPAAKKAAAKVAPARKRA
jgi:hypothetical protein